MPRAEFVRWVAFYLLEQEERDKAEAMAEAKRRVKGGRR